MAVSSSSHLLKRLRSRPRDCRSTNRSCSSRSCDLISGALGSTASRSGRDVLVRLVVDRAIRDRVVRYAPAGSPWSSRLRTSWRWPCSWRPWGCPRRHASSRPWLHADRRRHAGRLQRRHAAVPHCGHDDLAVGQELDGHGAGVPPLDRRPSSIFVVAREALVDVERIELVRPARRPPSGRTRAQASRRRWCRSWRDRRGTSWCPRSRPSPSGTAPFKADRLR